MARPRQALLQLLANADQLTTTRGQELCMSLAATPFALLHEFRVSGNGPQRVEPGIAQDRKVAEKSTLYRCGQCRERPLCFVNSRKVPRRIEQRLWILRDVGCRLLNRAQTLFQVSF